MPRSKQPAVRPPRWQRRPTVRPEEILRAALAEFAAAGYARARIADIARRAGVSKGTLYLYFDSKATLFRELMRAELRAWLPPEDAAAGFFPDTGEKQLWRFLRDTWAMLRRPDVVRFTRLVYAEQPHFPELAQLYFEEVVQQLRARLSRILDFGRARGEFRILPHPTAVQALPGWLIHQALSQDSETLAGAVSVAEPALLEGTLDLFLHGLLRRGSRSSAE